MNIHNPIDDVRYDSTRDVVLLREASRSSWSEHADLATFINALSATIVPDTLLPLVGIYALTLAAHEHSGWPTESRRAARIQATQQVRDACSSNPALDQALDAALTLADGALMRGDADIESMLVDFARVQSEE